MIGISVSIEIGTAGGGGDSVAPTVTARTIDAAGTSLTLTFSEAVTGSTGFSLTASGGAVTPSYASGSGTSSYTFTLSRTIAQGETVTLSYTPGNVADGAGNALASITNAAVTNSSTQTPITLSSAVIGTSGTSLTLTFGAAVTGFSSGAEGFALTGLTGGATTLTYASGNGTTTVVMTISRTVAQSETNGALAYTAGDITAVTGGVALANFSGTSVTNNSTQTPITLSSATIQTNGTTLRLVFGAAASGFASGAEGFALTGLTGGATTLTYSSGNGTTTVDFTISRTVYSSETSGALAYTAGDIVGANTLALANFSGTAVTNSSTQLPPPSTVSGLGLWLEDLYTSSLWEDSSFTTPATNGDPVGGWQDQSGSGRHATQGTAGARPILRSGTAADGLQFDATDDWMAFAGSALTNNYGGNWTVYVVFYWPNATYQGALVANPLADAELGVRYNSGNMRVRIVPDSGDGDTNQSVGPQAAGYYVARFRRTGATTAEVKVAGATAINITLVSDHKFTLTGLSIQGFNTANGRIRAVYAWPTASLNDSQMAIPEDWIDYYYGVRP